MKYYSATNKKEILPFATVPMAPGEYYDKWNLSVKDNNRMLSLICGINAQNGQN